MTCYLCDKDLDGWEYEDNPSVEHLKHCPDCGWARVAVTQSVDDDRKHVDDPRGEVMLDARLMTFGKKWWPHEDKKGWVPKVHKVCFLSYTVGSAPEVLMKYGQMADAGWHYAPMKESNDFAICAYCELSLDGWEAGDDPMYVSILQYHLYQKLITSQGRASASFPVVHFLQLEASKTSYQKSL